jgi:hypothetical protein
MNGVLGSVNQVHSVRRECSTGPVFGGEGQSNITFAEHKKANLVKEGGSFGECSAPLKARHLFPIFGLGFFII